jgi:ABC-type branched-subunit amino acid transport system substrate-binding protein
VNPITNTGYLDLNQAPATLNLGGLFPLTGALAPFGVENEAGALMAVDEINSNPDILPDTVLNFITYDTMTDPTIGALRAQDLIDLDVFGIIGAASSSVSSAVALVSEAAQVPQISYASTSAALSNKSDFPYFLRVVAPDVNQGVAHAHLLIEYGITDVTALYENVTFNQETNRVFEETFVSLGGTILASEQFETGSTDVTTQLQTIKSTNANITVLNAWAGDAHTVFSNASSLGLSASNGWQWITSDVSSGAFYDQLGVFNATLRDEMIGTFGTSIFNGEGPLYDRFLDLWETCNGKTLTDYPGCGDRSPEIFVNYAYDAVYTITLAAHEMIVEGQDPTVGADLLSNLRNTHIEGATGLIRFDVNQDRPPKYDIFNLVTADYVDIGTFDSASLHLTQPIVWSPGYVIPFETRSPTDLTLGGLFTFSGDDLEREAIFRLAVEEVNRDPNVLPFTNLMSLSEDIFVDGSNAVTAAQLLNNSGVFGYIGPSFSQHARLVAPVSEIAQIPQMGFSTTASDLSNKTEYPYFLRVIPPDDQQGFALADLIFGLGIDSVVTLSGADEFSQSTRILFEDRFTSLGGNIPTSQLMNAGDTDVTPQLQAIVNSGAHVILLNVWEADATTVFKQAPALGITPENGYQWFAGSGPMVAGVYGADLTVRDAMQGLVGTTNFQANNERYQRFLDVWESCNGQTQVEYPTCGHRSPSIFAAYIVDAVYAYAHAAHEMVLKEKDPNDGAELLTTLKTTRFEGLTGDVYFNTNYDRPAIYDVLNLASTDFIRVGHWDIDHIVLTGTITLASGYPPVTTTTTTTTTSSTTTDSTTTTTTTTTSTSTTSSSKETETTTSSKDEVEETPGADLPGLTFYLTVFSFMVMSTIYRKSERK